MRIYDLIQEIEQKARGLNLTKQQLAKMIDLTLLRPEARRADYEALCNSAVKHGFVAVCVFPHWVEFCYRRLGRTGVRVASVVGFPFGSSLTKIKAKEAVYAVSDGASEIDMVMNISALKDGDYRYVYDDIRSVVKMAGVPVKVILETGLLTIEEIAIASEIAKYAGAEYVKTSTGFGPMGATTLHVYIMSRSGLKVKASGGVKITADALRLIAAGASRIGATAGVQIVEGVGGDWVDRAPCDLCPAHQCAKAPVGISIMYQRLCGSCYLPIDEIYGRVHDIVKNIIRERR